MKPGAAAVHSTRRAHRAGVLSLISTLSALSYGARSGAQGTTTGAPAPVTTVPRPAVRPSPRAPGAPAEGRSPAPAPSEPVGPTISERPAVLTEIERSIPLRGGPGPGARYLVDDYSSRDVDGGCTYTVGISGVIAARAPAESAASSDTRFATRLDAGAVLRCPGRVPVRSRSHRLRRRNLDEAALLAALSSLTRIRSDASGHRCDYVPRFELTGEQVRSPSITYSCQQARGGGPSPAGRRAR